MPRPDETVAVLCIENLHSYELPLNAAHPECPLCGCKYARVDRGRHGSDVAVSVVTDVKEPYAVPVANSWVSQIPEKKTDA